MTEQTPIVVETPPVETAEPAVEQVAEPVENIEVDPLGFMETPTERKPEYFERETPIDENLPDFDPPPVSEPEPMAEPSPATVIDPDRTLSRVPKNIVSQGAKMAAPVVVEVIDSVIPPLINIYAKEDDYEQFCASKDAKQNMSNALAELMGSKNYELSPGWVFAIAVVAAYAPACISAYELRNAKKKISDQQLQITELTEKQREEERKRIDAEKLTVEMQKELNEMKLKNAELAKKTAETEVKTKKLAEKKPAKSKTTKKEKI